MDVITINQRNGQTEDKR